MKDYIGTKIIKAEPMRRSDFNKTHQPNAETSVGDYNIEGYLVEYPDGHISWSPKDVFDKAYREISDEEKIMISGKKQ